jgi:hypothetical protein
VDRGVLLFVGTKMANGMQLLIELNGSKAGDEISDGERDVRLPHVVRVMFAPTICRVGGVWVWGGGVPCNLNKNQGELKALTD